MTERPDARASSLHGVVQLRQHDDCDEDYAPEGSVQFRKPNGFSLYRRARKIRCFLAYQRLSGSRTHTQYDGEREDLD